MKPTPDEDLDELGRLLRTARGNPRAGGVSQDTLAERLGMGQSDLSAIENSRSRVPSPAILRRLAKALGISEAALFDAAALRDARHRNLDDSDLEPTESYTDDPREVA